MCYRGCDASRVLGASWSLDRAIANSFPFRPRYQASDAVLVTAVVRNDRILAVGGSASVRIAVLQR